MTAAQIDWPDVAFSSTILLGSLYGLYLVTFRWNKLRAHSRTLDYYFYWQIFFWFVVFLLAVFADIVMEIAGW
jgi:hypothetical protein